MQPRKNHARHHGAIRLLAVLALLAVTSCDGGETEEPEPAESTPTTQESSEEAIAVEEEVVLNGATSAWNVQFLTPTWFPGTLPGHWPNDPTRADGVAQSLGCKNFVLLNEIVNEDRRSEIDESLHQQPGCEGIFRFDTVLLQHDWDFEDYAKPDTLAAILEELVRKASDAIKAELRSFASEAGADELAREIADIDSYVHRTLEIGATEPRPVIDEEIGIITRHMVVATDHVEFSEASGFDRLAAKGALYAAVQVSDRRLIDPFTGLPAEQMGTLICSSVEELGKSNNQCAWEVAIDPPGTPAHGTAIDLFTTHFDTSAHVRDTQITELAQLVADNHVAGRPLMIAGDFNIRSGPGSQEFDDLFSALEAAVAPDVLVTFPNLGPTNAEGWVSGTSDPSAQGAGQIDHFFVANMAMFDPAVDFNPISPRWTVTGDAYWATFEHETMSDHAELEANWSVIAPLYPSIPAPTEDRLLTVTMPVVHLDDTDPWPCGAPDPQGTLHVAAADFASTEEFGPADDVATVSTDIEIVLEVPAGVTSGIVRVDLTEYDETPCGSSDDAPIDPTGSATDAVIALDFTRLDGILAVDTSTNAAWSVGEFNREFQLRGFDTGNYATLKIELES